MARKRRKKTTQKSKAQKHIPKKLITGLNRFEALVDDGELEEAELLLASLTRRYPRHWLLRLPMSHTNTILTQK